MRIDSEHLENLVNETLAKGVGGQVNASLDDGWSLTLVCVRQLTPTLEDAGNKVVVFVIDSAGVAQDRFEV